MAGLYIHIPFCVKKCSYCDFHSGENISLAPEYLSALADEMRMHAEAGRMSFDTVYIGGGTPSLLPQGGVAELMDSVRANFDISAEAEISMECNPGTAAKLKMNEYRESGINRLSVGLQTGNDAILAAIGRIHNRNDYIDTMIRAHEAGFENINTDLMYGLPGQDKLDFADSIMLASQFGSAHISAYSLILEPDTPMFDSVLAGETILPDSDDTADMQDMGIETLAGRGYVRYEISNFARPGCECRHNINYWQNGEFLGVGAAAHSALRRDGLLLRRENITSAADYIAAVKGGDLPVLRAYASSAADEEFETIMLALRMTDGLDLARFQDRFGVGFLDKYSDTVAGLITDGLMFVCDGRAALTDRGLDIQNSVLLRFM